MRVLVLSVDPYLIHSIESVCVCTTRRYYIPLQTGLIVHTHISLESDIYYDDSICDIPCFRGFVMRNRVRARLCVQGLPPGLVLPMSFHTLRISVNYFQMNTANINIFFFILSE